MARGYGSPAHERLPRDAGVLLKQEDVARLVTDELYVARNDTMGSQSLTVEIEAA